MIKLPDRLEVDPTNLGTLGDLSEPDGHCVAQVQPHERLGSDGVKQKAYRNALAACIAHRYNCHEQMVEALDNLVSACRLPGNHCEIEQAYPHAIAALKAAEGK